MTLTATSHTAASAFHVSESRCNELCDPGNNLCCVGSCILDSADVNRCITSNGYNQVGPDAGGTCLIDGQAFASGATRNDGCLICSPNTNPTAWSFSADGTACGSGEICKLGVCTAGCSIDGTYYAANAANPNNACQSCQPAANTTRWSNVAAGASCGVAGNYCSAGNCASGCVIGGAFYAGSTANPSNSCQQCAPASNATNWTNLEGTSCGTGEICHASTCGLGCYVNAGYYTSNAVNPNNPCQTCQPGATTSAFTSVADGTNCGNGQVCVGGNCGTQCDIGGKAYASGASNPADKCDICQPGTSTSSWTYLADGSSCGAAGICVGGQCGSRCDIGATGGTPGTVYTPGAVNPADVCQICQPAASTSTWSNVSNGTSCGTNATCSSGQCACNVGFDVCSGQCVDTTSDPNNCGGCARSCSAYANGICSDSLCAYVLASGLQDVRSVATDGTNVYWVDEVLEEVLACPVGGCAGAPSVIASNQSYVSDVVTDGINVYFADVVPNSGNGVSYTIAACPVGGCGAAPTVLATGQLGQSGYVSNIVTDGTNVYWNAFPGDTIVACAVGGCSGTPRVVVPGSDAVYAVATDGTRVYWTDLTQMSVLTCPVSGCATAAQIASGVASGGDIAADGTNVYWISLGAEAIEACPVVGCGASPTVIASSQTVPSGITTDGINVYWVESSQAILTCPVSGCVGAPQVLANGQAVSALSVAVASANLYWESPNAIEFVPK